MSAEKWTQTNIRTSIRHETNQSKLVEETEPANT